MGTRRGFVSWALAFSLGLGVGALCRPLLPRRTPLAARVVERNASLIEAARQRFGEEPSYHSARKLALLLSAQRSAELHAAEDGAPVANPTSQVEALEMSFRALQLATSEEERQEAQRLVQRAETLGSL